MNGVGKVKIKGVEYPLKFGVQALLVYEEEIGKNPLSNDSTAAGLAASCIIFYAGLVGNAIRSRQPILSFEEVFDLFHDELALEPDFNEQVMKMWEVFNLSIKPIIAEKTAEMEEVKKKARKKS